MHATEKNTWFKVMVGTWQHQSAGNLSVLGAGCGGRYRDEHDEEPEHNWMSADCVVRPLHHTVTWLKADKAVQINPERLLHSKELEVIDGKGRCHEPEPAQTVPNQGNCRVGEAPNRCLENRLPVGDEKMEARGRFENIKWAVKSWCAYPLLHNWARENRMRNCKHAEKNNIDSKACSKILEKSRVVVNAVGEIDRELRHEGTEIDHECGSLERESPEKVDVRDHSHQRGKHHLWLPQTVLLGLRRFKQ